MARQTNRLSARKVVTLKTPGRHADGGGLYLVVDKNGGKRWAFMSWKFGRQIELGLGGLSSVALAAARERAAECRKLIAEGRDPREARRAANAIPTFSQFAEEVVSSIEVGFRNDKHRAQWRSTLKAYTGPISTKPVDVITTEDILACLKPIWTTKGETASRVRGRIEKILDAAKAKGHRTGENPARWRGHLDHLLPKRSKLQRNHPAMPWQDVPAFLTRLRQYESVAALALEFTILNAARTSEVLLAPWTEFDLKTAVWTIPANRMKAAREHRVPLSGRAREILQVMADARVSDFVFPGQRKGRPLSNMAMEMVLRRMNVHDATVHGFRSSFRDWAGDETSFPREVMEAALSHVSGDQTERAYRRSDALEKRRQLMKAWELHCSSAVGANVV